MSPRLVPIALALVPALASMSGCFKPADATRGLPCTDDDACAPLTCSYGVCGGPVRCEAGAGVGDYCFTLDEREFEVGAGIDALAVGTVDFDALPDLVVGNGAAGTLALLRNVGGGDFAAPVVSGPLGAAATEIAIGSVDGMQWSDAVVTTDASSLVLVPLVPASGDGAFESPLVMAMGVDGAARPKIGQFVDDPNVLPDVAALVADGFDVVPQVDRGVFGEVVHTELASSADLRTFGVDASRVYVASEAGNSVVGHARAAGGAFTATTTIDVGPSPVRFVLEDLDGDTFGDVLSAGADGKLWLTTGRDATFADPRSPIEVYDLGWQPTTLLALNLDDDRDPEYLVSGAAPGGRRDVYLFDNDGEGRPIYGGSFGVDDASSVALADIDLDGVAEILIASQDRGTIRVARRAVAPPPPGGEESSGTTKGGSDPTDPTDPTDPSASDPSMESDPTAYDDTGIPVECSYVFDLLCLEIVSEFPQPVAVVAMAVGFVDLAAPPALVVARENGEVGSYVGFPEFLETPGPLFYAPGSPSDIAVGPQPGSDGGASVVVVTHEIGFTTYAPATPSVQTDFVIPGGTRAPVVESIINTDDPFFALPGIAVAGVDTGVYVATGPSLLDGADLLSAPSISPLTDLDVFGAQDFAAQILGSGGAASESFVVNEMEAGGLGSLPVAADFMVAVQGGKMPSVVTAYGGQIAVEAYYLDGSTGQVDTEDAVVVADFRIGDFDGLLGYDVAAMVLVDDHIVLRLYSNQIDGSLEPLGDIDLPDIRAFAVVDFSYPSELAVAYTDAVYGPMVAHLRPLIFGT